MGGASGGGGLTDLIVFKLQDFLFHCYINLTKCLQSNIPGMKREVAAHSYGTAQRGYGISSNVDMS